MERIAATELFQSLRTSPVSVIVDRDIKNETRSFAKLEPQGKRHQPQW